MKDLRYELRSISRGETDPEPTLEQLEEPHAGHRGRRLYVIQVQGRAHASPIGAVYVGQTKQTRHARFAEHNSGGLRSGHGLEGNCMRLRPELYAHLDLLPDDESTAMKAEYDLARRLANAGFAVQTNGRHYKPAPTHARHLFTHGDLRRVSRHLRRRLVTELIQVDSGAVDAKVLVHALRWCRDPDYGNPLAAFERHASVGRLAHVEAPAVEDLVRRILSLYR